MIEETGFHLVFVGWITQGATMILAAHLSANAPDTGEKIWMGRIADTAFVVFISQSIGTVVVLVMILLGWL